MKIKQLAGFSRDQGFLIFPVMQRACQPPQIVENHVISRVPPTGRADFCPA